MKSCFALALLVVAFARANAVSDCTPEELATIATAVDKQGGILHTCELDTGYTLFPFGEYPTGDVQRHVCIGRSCPTAISNLIEAKLPDCLIPVNGSAPVTAADFLKNVCVYTTEQDATSAPDADAASDDDGSDDSSDSGSDSA
ncbi:Elicitin, partial [Globisporangium splendens]